MVRLRSILLVGLVAVPALLQAADFRWYASDRQGWWFVTEKPDSGDTHTYSTFTGANNNTFVGNSRWGAKVQTDKYAGQIEFAIRHPKNAADAKVNVRLGWGQWNFTDKLGMTIGITDAPYSIKNAPQGYWEQVDQGKFSGKRSHNDKVMLYQLNVNTGTGVTGKLALINNEGDIKGLALGYGTLAAESIDTVKATKAYCPIPQIEGCVAYKSDFISLDIQGGCQTYNVKYKVKSNTKIAFSDASDQDVTSWVIGGDVVLKYSIFQLIAGFTYGTNTENMGINTSYKTTTAQYNDADVVSASPACVATLENGSLKDATQWGVPLSLTLSFSKTFSWVLAYGLCNVKEEKTNGLDVNQWSAYTNVQWKPLGGLTLAPEIGYIDFDEKVMKVAPQIYYGLFTQIDL
jgi:hypothetical protein